MELTKAQQLALDIARCAEVKSALSDPLHPCSVIVRTQNRNGDNYRQVPEAWAGNLETARILYVSSNPSISTPEVPGTGEDYPLAGYEDLGVPHPMWPGDNVRLLDFQLNRLDQERPRPFVTENSQFLCQDDVYRGSDKVNSTKASQKYWKVAINQARSLLGDEFNLTYDMCMTEIVHCKSKQEAGVNEASANCSEKYFHRILDVSNARLLIVGGRFARDLVLQNFKNWNEIDGHKWEIDEKFGFLKDEIHNPAAHVGLCTSGNKQRIVIACQQLSYASNKFRYVEQVLGQTGFANLKAMLNLPEHLHFETRVDLLRSLGLK